MDQGWVVFWAITVGLVAGFGYVAACRIWPYTDCPKCSGRGRFLSPSGRAWRHCRKCKGSGAKVRIGRRMWTWLAAVKKAAID